MEAGLALPITRVHRESGWPRGGRRQSVPHISQRGCPMRAGPLAAGAYAPLLPSPFPREGNELTLGHGLFHPHSETTR